MYIYCVLCCYNNWESSYIFYSFDKNCCISLVKRLIKNYSYQFYIEKIKLDKFDIYGIRGREIKC